MGIFQALTRLTLTFFSWLPPPTDNTKTPSLELRLLPFNQAAKELSQPSSLIRAVNSETLSVGNRTQYRQFFWNHWLHGWHYRRCRRRRGRKDVLFSHEYQPGYSPLFQWGMVYLVSDGFHFFQIIIDIRHSISSACYYLSWISTSSPVPGRIGLTIFSKTIMT